MIILRYDYMDKNMEICVLIKLKMVDKMDEMRGGRWQEERVSRMRVRGK